MLRGVIREQGGCYVSPTIFDNVAPEMAIAQEEIFGPVLSVMAFYDEREALSLANGTEYGLSATVWTRCISRSKRLAHGIHAGTVTVRTSGKDQESGCMLSFEPRRSSGFGSEIGLRGLQSYSTLKLVRFSGD